MKIESTKSSKVTSASAKRRLDSNADSSLFVSLVSASDIIDDTSPVISPDSVEGAGAIFETQLVGDATARKSRNQRAAKKGEDLLDKLENIRTALICGSVSTSAIISLSQALREKREPDIDPKLSAILDEIELRVEVELAKLEKIKR